MYDIALLYIRNLSFIIALKIARFNICGAGLFLKDMGFICEAFEM